jgi:hypothetical protein
MVGLLIFDSPALDGCIQTTKHGFAFRHAVRMRLEILAAVAAGSIIAIERAVRWVSDSSRRESDLARPGATWRDLE